MRRDVPMPHNAANGAVLLVQATTPKGTKRVVAFTFGTAGQHVLHRSWIEHGFGLRCALNACFPRIAPTDTLPSLRSIDSKAFDEVALDTRQLASRQVDFEVFGMNVQTDLLRAMVGRPFDNRTWGLSVRGRDSFGFSVLPGANLHTVSRTLLALWEATDYRDRFPWVDNIKPVRDEELVASLEEACVDAVRRLKLDLVGPEELDLANVSYYRIRNDPRANQRDFLDLKSYVDRLKRDGDLNITRLKNDWIESHDADGRPIIRKSVFECLAGDLRYEGKTFVIADGEFYEVDRDFMRALDRFIDDLPIHTGLPDGRLREDEKTYNMRAAQSPDIVLLDRNTVTIDGQASPIEPCDLLSRKGQLIHIKRHVRSSTLSHLFSQGVVAAELFATNDNFRAKLRELVSSLERERARTDSTYVVGVHSLITDTPPARNAHDVVFGIIANWAGRQASDVLPFFSKLNLRQRSVELERLGFGVALAKINYS